MHFCHQLNILVLHDPKTLPIYNIVKLLRSKKMNKRFRNNHMTTFENSKPNGQSLHAMGKGFVKRKVYPYDKAQSMFFD
jgi:hypothetical protein